MDEDKVNLEIQCLQGEINKMIKKYSNGVLGTQSSLFVSVHFLLNCVFFSADANKEKELEAHLGRIIADARHLAAQQREALKESLKGLFKTEEK